MATKDIFTFFDEVEGDIHVMENELIPDLEKTLAYLTDPDYKPDDNPDHEYREQDIDDCEWELAVHQRDLHTSKEKLGKLRRRLALISLRG